MATCDHPMRNGTCQLDPGHRGRHTTAAHGRCDGCSRVMRTPPYAYSRDGEHERGLAFCFLCVIRDERERDR